MSYIIVFLLAAVLTFAVKTVAIKRALIDIPNERSSHSTATPHGGGIALLTSFFTGLVWLYMQEEIDASLFWALVAVLPLTLVSLIDDIMALSARLRLAVQVICAAMALVALGGVEQMDFGLFTLSGLWVNLLALLVIIWMTNLYNFLDGIDGYAGSEAVFAGAAAFILFGSGTALLVAAAAMGFLLFNWHKASIFMGDVGSAPLGFVFAVMALHDAASSTFLGWIILLSLFWFDATLTLYRRFRNGEKLSMAHKKHIYQRLHQAGYSHVKVVLSGMGINLVLFTLLWIAGESHYGVVFLIAIAILWSAMKYVDAKKAFY